MIARLLALTLVCGAQAWAAPKLYYKYVSRKRAQQLERGDRLTPHFTAIQLRRRDLHAELERTLEASRKELIRSGVLPKETPSRRHSVFAGLDRKTWKQQFGHNAKLLVLRPGEESHVAVVNHAHLDAAWEHLRAAHDATGATRAARLKKVRALSVRYWTDRKGPGRMEALIGESAILQH